MGAIIPDTVAPAALDMDILLNLPNISWFVNPFRRSPPVNLRLSQRRLIALLLSNIANKRFKNALSGQGISSPISVGKV